MPVTTRSQKKRKVEKYDKHKAVKLLHGDMIHHNFQWKKGLNVLKEPFDSEPGCGPGGLYYCEAQNVDEHMHYIEPDLIADVTIPPGARTVTMAKKSKSDRVILSNIRPMDEWSAFDDEEFVSSYMDIRNIPESKRSETIYLAAVKENGYALKHVPEDKRTKELCLAAVKENGHAIRYVPEDQLSKEICLAAVTQNGYTLECVPEDKRSREICLAAVKETGDALNYVPDHLKEDICK